MAPKGSAMAFVLMLGVALSGCTDFEFNSTHDASLEVVDSSWEASGCRLPSSDDWCHEVTAHLTNHENGTALDVERTHWSAVADDGGVYSSESHEGPDGVAPNRTATFTITFETPKDVRLQTLRYESFFSEAPVTAPIRGTD